MKTVLIVEDDPTWAMIIADYVAQLGLGYVVVQSPQQAMDALDSGSIDLIILDMMLAVETGMTLLNEMRSYDDLSRVPVLVFTNLQGLNDTALDQYGVNALLNKSTATPDDIKYQIKELTSGRS